MNCTHKNASTYYINTNTKDAGFHCSQCNSGEHLDLPNDQKLFARIYRSIKNYIEDNESEDRRKKLIEAKNKWLVSIYDLKEGDRIFFISSDFQYTMDDYDRPETVETVSNGKAYLDTSNWGMVKLQAGTDTKVWRVPDGWDQRYSEYLSERYWLS